ncbi:hypothetical protein DFP91_3281 [Pseudorhodoplanes sinuspersici]|nr:hypothetical protein [Pseudorhodoplanes sinuspersici]RKE71028.1 hypothetical protein DFP91_3281 [Pseudorhodoplanes sinuspersici]
MIIRIIHFCVIVAMIAAATYVYDIKFESTMQAERLARIRGEIRRERDAIAALRAEWAKLDSPDRIEGLAQRHLPLKATDARQFDQFANLPERPKPPLFADEPDPIGALLSIEQEKDIPTGSTGGRNQR